MFKYGVKSTMNDTQTLYTINKIWALAAEMFFGAAALLVLDSRFFPGILTSGLIISIFIFVLAHKPNIDNYRKYDSMKDISDRKLPVTSDIRIVMAALISLITMLALLLISSLLPYKYMNAYDLNSLTINFFVMLAFFLYSIIVRSIYRFSVQSRNYNLTKSQYYKCTYEVQNLKYIKSAMIILLISSAVIGYRIYQLIDMIDNGKKVFFYY